MFEKYKIICNKQKIDKRLNIPWEFDFPFKYFSAQKYSFEKFIMKTKFLFKFR